MRLSRRERIAAEKAVQKELEPKVPKHPRYRVRIVSVWNAACILSHWHWEIQEHLRNGSYYAKYQGDQKDKNAAERAVQETFGRIKMRDETKGGFYFNETGEIPNEISDEAP